MDRSFIYRHEGRPGKLDQDTSGLAATLRSSTYSRYYFGVAYVSFLSPRLVRVYTALLQSAGGFEHQTSVPDKISRLKQLLSYRRLPGSGGLPPTKSTALASSVLENYC